jgi:hypothetical protein
MISQVLEALNIAIAARDNGAITEWKRIRAKTAENLCSVLIFPVFMATYVPIAAVSLFSRAEWKPTRHNPML